MPSRRNMIEMTHEETKEFVETGWTLQVASIGSNGWPHLVAMWYGIIDEKIHFTTYAKAQKVLNLKRDPRITVMLESGTEYSKIKGLVIEGNADVVENDPDLVMAVQDATGRKRSPQRGRAGGDADGQRTAPAAGIEAGGGADQPDAHLLVGPREAGRPLLGGASVSASQPLSLRPLAVERERGSSAPQEAR